MQCVILAAGKGTRLLPLTKDVPKPLVKINGKPIIEHIVSALPEEIDELIVVVGYKGEMIREHCGNTFLGRKVRYREQSNPVAGTGDALLCAKDTLLNRFLFMYGDDILSAGSLQELMQHEYAVSGYRMDDLGRFGPIHQREDGSMSKITLGRENVSAESSGVAYIGGALVDTAIFDYVSEKNRDHESLLIEMLNGFSNDHVVQLVTHDFWAPIGFPKDLKRAEALLNE